jgi:hypothetical protein
VSFEKEISGKVEELSRDLEGDLELQLDVQFELENHLWESYDANIEHGMSEAESSEQAFKDFGALNEVKERLLAGNLKRLNKRAKFNALMWYAFVPFSIVLAVVLSVYDVSQTVQKFPKSSLDPKILNVRSLAEEFDENLYQDLVEELPQNAYLDSLWISHHMEDYINKEDHEVKSEEAFSELLLRVNQMVGKHEFTAYWTEEIKAYKDHGRPGLVKTIRDIGNSASFILPSLGAWRDFASVVIKRGKAEEVLLLEKVCAQRLKNSGTLIEVLVIGAIANIYVKNENLVQREDLKSSTEFFSHCSAVIQDWKAEKKTDISNDELLKTRSGILASMVLPAIGNTEEMKDPDFYTKSRELEYNFLEKSCFSVLNYTLFLLVLVFIGYLSWQKFISKNKASLQVYSMREWLSHWLKFMALPLVIYQVYKLLPFASIHWNIKEKIYLYPIELLSMTAAVFVLSFYVLLNKYCKKLVIFDLVDKKSVDQKCLLLLMCFIIIPIVVVFGFSLKQFAEELFSMVFLEPGFNGYNYWVPYGLVFIFFLLIFLFTLWFFKISPSAFKSIVQGQLINSAFIIITVSLYSLVYIGGLEKNNASKDQLFNFESSFSSVEEKVTEQLKQDMLSE